MSDDAKSFPILDTDTADGDAISTLYSVPYAARAAHEIPRPAEWAQFQAACVILFREELKDPNACEYGRLGQEQDGIDILGRRNRDINHLVGIQCRRVAKPLKEAKILSDCRAALAIDKNLKEIIFATTAPNDTKATKAALAVEKLLRGEGHDVTVTLFGWGNLETLIRLHEPAYNAFFPQAVASKLPPPSGMDVQPVGGQDTLARMIAEQVHLLSIGRVVPDTSTSDQSSEDPALHAKIDLLRDQMKQQEPLIAKKGLKALRETAQLDTKPWARFRIETNLGAAALELGNETEGAAHFEAAYAMRPTDPTAIANLALARTIQGKFDEGMELSRKALAADKPAEGAVSTLLQAAARSGWVGDPETLIPEPFKGSVHADLGLAEFLRRRETPGWERKSLAIAEKHAAVPEFKRIAGIATLSLAINSGAIVPGGKGPLPLEQMSVAATDMKEWAEHCLNVGYADRGDLFAYLNNAALLLRIVGRQTECEALLRRGISFAPEEAQFRRLLAVSLAARGAGAEARRVLEGDTDPENRLLAADILAHDDIAAALREALLVPIAGLEPRVIALRWRMLGEMAVAVSDVNVLRDAVAGLLEQEPDGVSAGLLQIRWDRQAGASKRSIRRRLKQALKSIPADASPVMRYVWASEFRDAGLHDEALQLIEPVVDLHVPSPATRLYLQALGAARRDAAFQEAVGKASAETANDPDILWARAAHAWNIGNLPEAKTTISALLELTPDNAKAHLFRIEVLVRQNDTEALLIELEKRVEDIPLDKLKDRLRIAQILLFFGFRERAAALSYRLYLENRDKPRAWMALTSLLMDEQRSSDGLTWQRTEVGQDTAIEIDYDGGESVFVVSEPDEHLRGLDSASWEPNHTLLTAIAGLRAGDPFTLPNGKKGTIRSVRHKYIARLQQVMQAYEERFPGETNFQSISVNPKEAGGLDELTEQLKSRHDWLQQEQGFYLNGPMPLGVFAYRVGLDTIDVAQGLAAQGVWIKAAAGSVEERDQSISALAVNAKGGCVLDLLAFWASWRLEAIVAVEAACGKIHIPQSVIDRLHARREKLQYSEKDGLKTAGIDDGHLRFFEVHPDVIRRHIADLDRALEWIAQNAVVCPVLITEATPAEMKKLVRSSGADLFDALVIAHQRDILLVSDDLPTRQLARSMGFHRSVHLHPVITVCSDSGIIPFDTYIRWTAALIDSGHGYIGVTGVALARACVLDAQDGPAPGPLFKALSRVIGGKIADPVSHLKATLDCLQLWWQNPKADAFRQAATGHLIDRLVSERTQDYQLILRALRHQSKTIPMLSEYIAIWLRGHFLEI